MAGLTGLGCYQVHYLSSVGGLGQILTHIVRILNNLGNICSDLFEFTMSFPFGKNRIEGTQETYSVPNNILNIQLAVRFCWEISSIFKALNFSFSLF